MTMEVTSLADFELLSHAGLNVVVDPMVVRCGEVFLNGVGRANDAAQSWGLLERNVHALALFFDSLILEERILVFNYGDTFDMELNFNQRIFADVNAREPILYDVNAVVSQR